MSDNRSVLIVAEPISVTTVYEDDVKTFEEMTLKERIRKYRIQKQNSLPRTLRWLKNNKDILRMDLVIQREEVWDDNRNSRLIESVLLGRPIPPLYTLKSPDNLLWLMDGKQRGLALITFQEDLWALSADIDSVYGIDVAGKKFSELPEEFRELFDEQTIDIYELENLTIEQRDEIFYYLNNGKHLRPFEIICSLLGSQMLEYISEIAERPFIKKVANISPTQRKNKVDKEIVLQVIGLLTDKIDNVSGATMREFAINLRENGLSNEERQMISNVFDYLDVAFNHIDTKKQKLLRKSDIIAVANIVEEALLDDIKHEEFGTKIIEFLDNPTMAYKNTKASQSASKTNVNDRIKIIYDKTIKKG